MLQTKAKCQKAILLLFALLSLLAVIPKLFVGFDIDEGYAVAMPYRLLQGDRLFGEMWEIHQTSALLPALLMKPYIALTGGTEGIVLYLRFVAALIHTFMTCVFYAVAKNTLPAGENKEDNTKAAILAALLYFNILPKWLLNLDFSMQQLWGLTLICGLLILEERRKKATVSLLTGAALSLTVLGYPGMIVLYPAILCIYLIIDKDNEIKFRIKKCIYLTLACGILAAAFLAYVISRVGMAGFTRGLTNIFSDGTHSLSKDQQLLLDLSRILNLAKQWIVFLAAALMASALIGAACHTVKKRKASEASRGDKESVSFNVKGIFDIRNIACYVAVVTSLLIIFGQLVGIRMGPFHFQSRFLLLFVLIWIRRYKERKWESSEKMLFVILLLTTVAFAGILLFSNVGPDASGSYLSIGLILGLVAFLPGGEEHRGFLPGAAILLFLLSVIMSKGFYVRYTEYFPADILQKRVAVTAGPLKGIRLLEQDAETEQEGRDMVVGTTKPGQICALLGTDQILNLSMQGKAEPVSTISTPAFNGQWITYYECYPELLPDVIFIAKNTVDDRQKFFEKNEFGIWLAERYDIANMEENGALCRIERSN